MARTSSFSKQALVVFLAFVLHFTAFTTAYAANWLSPWTVNILVPQGASSILTGSKEVVLNGAKKVATGTAKITPVAADVSKLLVKGLGGVALTFAVEQLLGAVDWVLDPANNQIKYKDSNNTACLYMSYVASRTDLAACGLQNAFQNYINKVYGKTALVSYKDFIITSCRANGATGTSVASGTCYFTAKHKTTGNIIDSNETLHSIANPNYSTDKEEKTISLNTVAERIISNAESGNAAAQSVTSAAAADIVSDAEKDSAKAAPILNQLENSQAISTDQTAKGNSKPQDTTNTNTNTNTAEPQNQAKPQDITLNFPIFCDWAPSICLAAKEVIAFPKTLTNWWDKSTKSITEAYELAKTKAKAVEDYFNDKPEKDTDTQLDIDPVSPVDINTDINFGGSCPQSKSVPVSFAGVNTTIEFSYLWMCQLSEFLKPIVVALASYAAALIVAGIRQEND